MTPFLPTLVRFIGTFAVFCVAQYLIPWYLLTAGGIVAGFFMLKTSDDRPLSMGVLLGSIAFGIFAYAMSQMYPTGG